MYHAVIDFTQLILKANSAKLLKPDGSTNWAEVLKGVPYTIGDPVVTYMDEKFPTSNPIGDTEFTINSDGHMFVLFSDGSTDTFDTICPPEPRYMFAKYFKEPKPVKDVYSEVKEEINHKEGHRWKVWVDLLVVLVMFAFVAKVIVGAVVVGLTIAAKLCWVALRLTWEVSIPLLKLTIACMTLGFINPFGHRKGRRKHSSWFILLIVAIPVILSGSTAVSHAGAGAEKKIENKEEYGNGAGNGAGLITDIRNYTYTISGR